MKKLICILVLTVVALFSFQAEAIAQRTGIYVNNREVTVVELQQLQQVTGPLGRAAYYIDQQGNFGVVGYYPVLNIHQRIAQLSRTQRTSPQYWQKSSGDYHRRGSNGIYGNEGGSSYYQGRASSITKNGSNLLISGANGKVIYFH